LPMTRPRTVILDPRISEASLADIESGDAKSRRSARARSR
jgi:hypothetical protein